VVVLEARMFKIITSFSAENMGEKGVFSGVGRLKIIILHEQGYSEQNRTF